MGDELFPRVNDRGEVIGSVARSRAHGDPTQMHPVVHCLVTNERGELLLQLRSRHKDIQPGRWDTSVGGHVAYGEAVVDALRRELREEIGLHAERAAASLRFLYRYVHRSEVETELVHTYTCVHGGPFVRQEEEIDELRFWSAAEIEAALGTGQLTPNFEQEYARFRRALT